MSLVRRGREKAGRAMGGKGTREQETGNESPKGGSEEQGQDTE